MDRGRARPHQSWGVDVQPGFATDDASGVPSFVGIWKSLMGLTVPAGLLVVKAGIDVLSTGGSVAGGIAVIGGGWFAVVSVCAAIAYVDRWPVRVALASLVIPALMAFVAIGWVTGLVDLGPWPLAIPVLVVCGGWVAVVTTSPTWPRARPRLVVAA